MSGRTATERLDRLLAMVPWIADQPAGVPVDEVCERFQVTPAELVDDIHTVMMTGVHPFTPDMMIEAWVDDHLVTIHYADDFARPLRLTADEAVALVTAARGLATVPGWEDDGPLDRAITKLERVMGTGRMGGIDVDLGRVGGPVFTSLETALADRTQVEIDYPDAGDGAIRTRRIEPANLFSSAGRWYVSGWCHRADDRRVFRVDRIHAAQITDEPFTGNDPDTLAVVDFDSALPQVVLKVDRQAAWLLDRVPVLDPHDDDEFVTVRLAVGSQVWLARFLLQLGSAVEVVESDASIDPGAIVVTQARRTLDHYR